MEWGNRARNRETKWRNWSEKLERENREESYKTAWDNELKRKQRKWRDEKVEEESGVRILRGKVYDKGRARNEVSM